MSQRREKSDEAKIALLERIGGMRDADVQNAIDRHARRNDLDNQRMDELDAKIEALFQAVQVLSKTVEGIQQLFVKAGEYQGKPRGRLPR